MMGHLLGQKVKKLAQLRIYLLSKLLTQEIIIHGGGGGEGVRDWTSTKMKTKCYQAVSPELWAVDEEEDEDYVWKNSTGRHMAQSVTRGPATQTSLGSLASMRSCGPHLRHADSGAMFPRRPQVNANQCAAPDRDLQEKNLKCEGPSCSCELQNQDLLFFHILY